jgi:hypothetical protein
MMRDLSILLIVLFVMISPSVGHADWSFRPQAGLGFTNNANFEETNRDADFYILARGSGTYFQKTNSFTGTLSYRNYFKEEQNNVVGFQLSGLIPVNIVEQKDWQLEAALGGQNYTHTAPGTTEDAFDNFYGSVKLIKTVDVDEQMNFSIEPGYMLRNYPKLNSRTDHILSVSSYMDWIIRPDHTLEPFAEIGVAVSNEKIYTRTFLELGTDYLWSFKKNLRADFSLTTRLSSYPNRTVSTSTVVSNRRGIRTRTMQDDKERFTFTQVGAALAKINKDSEFKAGLIASSQRTRSGAENYSEFGMIITAQFSF